MIEVPRAYPRLATAGPFLSNPVSSLRSCSSLFGLGCSSAP